MRLYCIVGYYDMNDGMKRNSELHGCFVNEQEAKNKMNYLITQLVNDFANQHSEYSMDFNKNSWSIYKDTDVATLEIVEQNVEDYDVEKEITMKKTRDYLVEDMAEETLYPELTDEEFDEVAKSVGEQMFYDYDRQLMEYFIQQMRNRAINHPIIQGKRIEQKRAAKK